MNKIQVGMIGTGSYLPEKVLTNQDLEKIVDTSDEWIHTRTGIRERRIAQPDTAASDLGLRAAQAALENAGISADQLDLIIVATLTPDYTFPSTACVIQERLQAKKAAAFDLSAACSGFVYGVATGAQFIASGMYRYVLVIGAEVLSKILNWEDRSTCVLFGDGAGACVLAPVDEGRGFHSFVLGADGKGEQLLYQPSSGSRMPITEQTIADKLHTLQMSGNEVFKFAVRMVAKSAKQAIEQAGLSVEDIDYFIPHQANIRIIEPAVERLGLSMDKVYVNLDQYGNMSSASIPVALDEAIRSGAVRQGSRILMVGFGAGLTWAAAVITL